MHSQTVPSVHGHRACRSIQNTFGGCANLTFGVNNACTLLGGDGAASASGTL